jgi:transcriptional regulator with XRE-family HTH domain
VYDFPYVMYDPEEQSVRAKTASSRAAKVLPKRLRQARVRAGVSTADAARTLGVRRPAISEMESDRRGCKATELTALAIRYGVSETWLLGRRSGRTRDDRAELAADVLANLSPEALGRLERAIRIVKERRGRAVNFPR